MQTIVDEVTRVISTQLNIPLEKLGPDTPLQDLGVESLDFIEIIFALEEKFDINIPYNASESRPAGDGAASMVELGQLGTIEKISAAVKDLIDAKTAA